MTYTADQSVREKDNQTFDLGTISISNQQCNDGWTAASQNHPLHPSTCTVVRVRAIDISGEPFLVPRVATETDRVMTCFPISLYGQQPSQVAILGKNEHSYHSWFFQQTVAVAAPGKKHLLENST